MSCEVSEKVLTLHILCEIFQDKISDKDRPHPLHMNGVEQIPPINFAYNFEIQKCRYCFEFF